MAEDLKRKVPRDTKLVSLKQDQEVKYWTEVLACSVMELKAAVMAVGHSAQRVKDYLIERHAKNK